jgi:hypothetical protein
MFRGGADRLRIKSCLELADRLLKSDMHAVPLAEHGGLKGRPVMPDRIDCLDHYRAVRELKDDAAYSFWLETCGDDLLSRPPPRPAPLGRIEAPC